MPAQSPSPHLEHGAILEDVLLIAHHAVLVERRDPLLRVLHDLRVRMVAARPRSGNGAREDGPGSGMGLSGMRDTHLDEEAVLQRRDVLAVAADLRRSQSGASCVIPFPLRNPTSTRHRQPPKHPPGTAGPPTRQDPPGTQLQWGRCTKMEGETPQDPTAGVPAHPRALKGAGDKAQGRNPVGAPPNPRRSHHPMTGDPTPEQPPGIQEGKGEESKPRGGEAPTRMLKGATPAWVLEGG